jgi:hypothetical protein
MDDKETRITVAATREMMLRLESALSDLPLERDLRMAFHRVSGYLNLLMSPSDNLELPSADDRRNYGLLALDAEVEAFRGVIDELKHEGDYEL